MTEWTLKPGESLTRDQRREIFGGALYGGIEPSAKSPNIFIYSDPARGSAYGYKYDGWNSDDSVYLYTGEGRVGDQLLTHGNKAIVEHKLTGRSLRLFVADGPISNESNEKNHIYLGEFEIDEDFPYYQADALDESQTEIRTVFVFRLKSKGQVIKREIDASQETEAKSKQTAELIDLERNLTDTFSTSGTEPSIGERREGKLVQDFTIYLEGLGHKVKRWKLTPKGEIKSFLTDPYDLTDEHLYEAKGSAAREKVRMAVGQLLDYKRLMETPPRKLSVLLPHEPSSDIRSFLAAYGIGCTWQQEDGRFKSL